MLRKRKIWEVIKASNVENCKFGVILVDATVVESKLEKLTKDLEVLH